MIPLCSTMKSFYTVTVFGYKYTCREYRTGLFYTDGRTANWLYMCANDMCTLKGAANIPFDCVEMKQ